jgi:hypothetical protein
MGTVRRVDRDPTFGPDVLLNTSDPAKPLRADLIEDSREAAASLEPGEAITVGCLRVQEHMGPDPWLRSCRIQPAPKALPAPSDPARAKSPTESGTAQP